MLTGGVPEGNSAVGGGGEHFEDFLSLDATVPCSPTGAAKAVTAASSCAESKWVKILAAPWSETLLTHRTESDCADEGAVLAQLASRVSGFVGRCHRGGE